MGGLQQLMERQELMEAVGQLKQFHSESLGQQGQPQQQVAQEGEATVSELQQVEAELQVQEREGQSPLHLQG